MDRFPGSCHQIDGETLRALHRLSNRLSGDSGVTTPDDRRDIAQRMRTLLRKTEQVEPRAAAEGNGGSQSPYPRFMRAAGFTTTCL